MIISLDTECTGLDLAHGARPFLVTTCDDDGVVRFWEWDVNPLTRTPSILSDDLADITELIDTADLIYLQNAKFDARALATVGIDLPWEKVRDTLVMGHLLATNHPHNLTWMCVEYLGVDIEPYETSVREVTKLCRTIARRNYPQWQIAGEGVDGMPSVQCGSKRDEDKPWKNDMWLPRALVEAGVTQYVPQHWHTACSAYANADSESTLYLGLELERLLRERRLWAIYEHRMHLPRIACEMEEYGVTAIGEYTDATVRDYEEHVSEAAGELRAIAAGYGHDLELAEGAAINDNMRDFFYGMLRQECLRCGYVNRVKHWNLEREDPDAVCPKCAGRKRNPMRHQLVTTRRKNLLLPVISDEKTGRATLDKEAMQEYLVTLDGDAQEFIRILTDKRAYDTALSYMEAYRRFWIPITLRNGEQRDFYRIHPSLNPCGTDHLRWSSNSPNMQNVSTGDDEGELSLRYCFGPLPDREWWRMDFQNIEKRIPAYEAQEPKLIEIFEHPDEPPYWGSDHLLLASLLFPDDFWPLAETRSAFKERHPRKYKHTKNTNFAKQYGAGKRKVDATAHVRGAFELIDRGLPELAKLQARYLAVAEKTGFVETLPDRTVDPTRGYPILASRTEDGRVLSTTPFNYHVSGTACWCKNTALVRCAAQCAAWRTDGFDANIALEVHDEILFDFPRGSTLKENLPRALVLKRLMEQAGEDLIPRIPTPVSIELHLESWAKGVAM